MLLCSEPEGPAKPSQAPGAPAKLCRAPAPREEPCLVLELPDKPLAGFGRTDPRQELIPHWSSRCPLVKSEVVGRLLDRVGEFKSPLMVRHGRCLTASDRHTTVSDAVHFCQTLKQRLRVNLVPNLSQETVHKGPGTVAEASSRSSWPTLALHPRGGHCGYRQTPFARLQNLRKSRNWRFDELCGL